MNLKPDISSRKYRTTDLSSQAEVACRLAKQLENAGDYEGAYEALAPFWPDKDGLPQVESLNESARAHMLQRVGALAGWLGGADQINGSQDRAKDLITKSIEIFEVLQQPRQQAEACADLALCYWREGAFDEARIHLRRTLQLLKNDRSDLKICVLLRAGVVEVDSHQLNEALRLYQQAAPLVEQSGDDNLKGAFHNQYARLFRLLGRSENIDSALIEYAAASYHFEQAGNDRYVARVENNLGYLYLTIKRHKEAHVHLDRARQLFQRLRDIGATAQVDETRARTLLAQGYVIEAERIVRAAVRVLERGGQQAVLAEALATHAVALARLGNDVRARALFDKAVIVAETAGDLEGAGRAKLTIIEELGRKIPAPDLVAIYRSAVDLLRNSQDPASAKRLISCAEILFDTLKRLEAEAEKSSLGSWEGFSLKRHVKAAESAIIERALRDAGGSVSKAAKLLGFKHHQSLISLLNGRHKDLLKTRSVVRKRRRHILKPRMGRKPAPKRGPRSASEISILYVEDEHAATKVVDDLLIPEDWRLDICADRDTALLKLTGDDRYDVLVFENDVINTTGLELVERARKITHRRRTAIIVVASDDFEKAAWRAGANAFLRKSEVVDHLASTIRRLIKDSKTIAD